MNEYPPEIWRWMHAHGWAIGLAQAVLMALAASAFVMVVWARSRTRRVVAGVVSVVLLVAVAALVWSQSSRRAMWQVSRFTESRMMARNAELSFEWAAYNGPVAAADWLRDAVEASQRRNNPVTFPFGVVRPSELDANGAELAERMRSAVLDGAQAEARKALSEARAAGAASHWCEVTRATARDGREAHVVLRGFALGRVYMDVEYVSDIVLDESFLQYGVVVQSADWMGEDGVWHPMLQKPVALDAPWMNDGALGEIAVVPDHGVQRVRCSAQLVVTMSGTAAYRTVPMEWEGAVR